MIDLRSDTATQPTAGMYDAMVSAPLGDDMLGEDPTVNKLEAMLVEMCDKEAAVFACSGTQSNQLGIYAHTRPGDELLINAMGHVSLYEGGAPAVLSGVTVRTIDAPDGMLDVEHLQDQIHADNQHMSPTRLVCLENTTNVGGGKCYDLEQVDRVGQWAHENGLLVHMDGARLFNAIVAKGYSPKKLLKHVDSVSICFSKGLGCPMGSMLVGSKEMIARARRGRKIVGGALRQAGVIAATAIYGLENNVERLAEDHAHAKQFAEGISTVTGIEVYPEEVETNLVFFYLDEKLGTAAQFSQELSARGIGIGAMGKQKLRACTHLGISQEEILTAIAAVKETLTSELKPLAVGESEGY